MRPTDGQLLLFDEIDFILFSNLLYVCFQLRSHLELLDTKMHNGLDMPYVLQLQFQHGHVIYGNITSCRTSSCM